MKQIIKDLHWEAKRELDKMKKTTMSLADRIAYERALEKLDLMTKLLNQCQIIFNQ